MKKEKAKRMQELEKSYDYSKYQTKFLDKILERDTQLQEEKEEKDEERARI